MPDQDAVNEDAVECRRWIQTHSPDRIYYQQEHAVVGEREITFPRYNRDGGLFRRPTVREYVHTTEPIFDHPRYRVCEWDHPTLGVLGYKERIIPGVPVLFPALCALDLTASVS